MSSIDESTRIPIAWFVLSLVFVASTTTGIVGFAIHLEGKANASEARLDKQKQRMDAFEDLANSIRVDVATTRQTVLDIKERLK